MNAGNGLDWPGKPCGERGSIYIPLLRSVGAALEGPPPRMKADRVICGSGATGENYLDNRPCHSSDTLERIGRLRPALGPHRRTPCGHNRAYNDKPTQIQPIDEGNPQMIYLW